MPATCFKRTGTGACLPLCYITFFFFFRKQHSVSVWYEMTLIVGVSKWNSAPFLVNIGRQSLSSQFWLYLALHYTWHVFQWGWGQDWTADAQNVAWHCPPVSRDIPENDVVGADTDVPLAQTRLRTSADANVWTLPVWTPLFSFFSF